MFARKMSISFLVLLFCLEARPTPSQQHQWYIPSRSPMGPHFRLGNGETSGSTAGKRLLFKACFCVTRDIPHKSTIVANRGFYYLKQPEGDKYS
jgi:hypothetical protein